MSSNSNRLFDHIYIDRNIAQKLISEFDIKAEVTNIQLIPEGLSTSNYIVTIEDSPNKYLLKIYPEGGGNSALEVASYKYAKQFVSVPQIYLYDDSKKICDNTYLLMENIDGLSLKKYVTQKKKFPEKIALKIGNNLALLHNRLYENMALLNETLDIQKILLPVSTLHERYLNDVAGEHISNELKYDVLKFLSENREMVNKLEEYFVYSHGDFNSSNILIDNMDNIWFIDFEYSLAAPIYNDIGKFFRDNSDLNKYRGQNIYNSFAAGYNFSTKKPLPNDWIKLAKLMDMANMLALINKKSVPSGWVKEIEEAIMHTMKVLRNEAPF